MELRNGKPEDGRTLAAIEAVCFPAAEAATEKDLQARLAVFPENFWLLLDGETVVAFVNSLTTELPNLTDEMYKNAAMHQPGGAWQMVLGLNTLPEYRKQGYATRVLQAAIAGAREKHCKGMVLTCKEHLLDYYSRFGFEDEGISKSTLGNTRWHQMRLTFDVRSDSTTQCS